MTIALLALALAAVVQSADGRSDTVWETIRTETVSLTALSLEDGVSLAARCRQGVFDFVIAGLPPVEGNDRRLRLSVDNHADYTIKWLQSLDGVQAFSPMPAPMARELIDGGQLTVTVMDGDVEGASFHYEIPSDKGAIGEVLTACGRPIMDERWRFQRAQAPEGMSVLRTAPQSRFPEEAKRAQVFMATVVMTCLARRNHRVSDCVVESESPPGLGFGRSVLRSAPQARVIDLDFPENGDPLLMFVTTTFLARPPSAPQTGQ